MQTRRKSKAQKSTKTIKDDKNVSEKIEKPQRKPKKTEKSHSVFSKKIVIILFVIALIVGAGLGYLGYHLFFKNTEEREYLSVSKKWNGETSETVSPLTGEVLSDSSLANSPTFCIQIPNGLDGARPQVGLNEAGVIFEAIAESGITRLAAIFQNPTATIIGPVRSLRIYYLEWDTPFDCTIVHAGGASDAISALNYGGYRNLDENYNYMWRGEAYSSLNRQWNNLFTSSENLKTFNSDAGFKTSNVHGFSRETEKDSDKKRIESIAKNSLDIDEKTDSSVKETGPKVKNITMNYGYDSSFNPTYTYNSETNSYDRFYGEKPHKSYKCTEDFGEATPENVCGEPVQLSPKVVIGMLVNESRASDSVHESIQTTGSGKAYIFQNGDVIDGSWEKPSKASQIVFKDAEGNEIKLAPGQTWISAIPNYGSVSYD